MSKDGSTMRLRNTSTDKILDPAQIQIQDILSNLSDIFTLRHLDSWVEE